MLLAFEALRAAHQAHRPPSTKAVKLAIVVMSSRRLVLVGGGAKHVGHPLPCGRKRPIGSFGHTLFLLFPQALMALHVLLDQKLFRMPMHGRESLRGSLEGPPTICGPRLV